MTRRGPRRTGALVALVVIGATGCSLARRTPTMRYYVLSVPATPPLRLPAPVRVLAVTADPVYATDRLAYRVSPFRLGYYTYRRWAADPRDIVASAMRDYLARAAPAEGGAPFEVEGRIRRIEEVDEPGGWSGALTLDLRIRREGRTVLEHSYAEEVPAGARSPEAVVAAISRALGIILDRVGTELAGRP
jgi:hypothetical protein